MTKVLGVDVCKSSIVCCVLTAKPNDVREAYYSTEFYNFPADAIGIKAVLELSPDIAIMEPTGINYQRLWGTHLARNGVEVRLVSNQALPAYRKSLDLPDKDDDADALALASYYFDFKDAPRRWLQIRDRSIARIREICLRLSHIARVQSPIINRLRQDLAWQFPEIMNCRAYRATLALNPPLLWRWIAGAKSKRYDSLYLETVGAGLTHESRCAAEMLCDLNNLEARLEMELSELTLDPRFDHYRSVFTDFGFGLRISGYILSQIYPIENFLDDDGQPIIVVRKGRNSGKPTRRYLSLRRFKKSLGVAPDREWSGDDTRSQKKAGSNLCRRALWQWCFTRIEVQRNRPKNAIGQTLGKMMDDLKIAKMPVKKLRSKVCAKAVEILFKRLSDLP